MAKGYTVRRMFFSPTVKQHITPSTSGLIDRLSESEIKHHLKLGNLVEVQFPPGATSVAEAEEKLAEAQTPDPATRSRKGGR